MSHSRHPVPRVVVSRASLCTTSFIDAYDKLQALQLWLGVLRQSRPFHHLSCYRRSLRKTTLEFVRVELKARDCPSNVVITDRVGKSVSVWHNCGGGGRGKHGLMEYQSREESCTNLLRIPIHREIWMTAVMSIAPSDSFAGMPDRGISPVEIRLP
jgi:hypothetical protein